MSMPAKTKHLSPLKSSSLTDSASPGLGFLDMPAFIERSNIGQNLRHAGCNDMFQDCSVRDQTGDSDDELLTVHFGGETTACNIEPIEVDSEEESSEVNIFVCSVCTMVCGSLQSLKQHEMIHSGGIHTACAEAEVDPDIMFVCSMCTVVCENLQSLKQHETTHLEELHTAYTEAEVDPDIMYVCSMCAMVCENLQSLKQHEMTHSTEVPTTFSEDLATEYSGVENSMFICSMCTMVCTSLPSLKRHEMTHLDGMCNSYYGDLDTYFSQDEINENQMPLCSICGMVCKDSHSLERHEMTHHMAYFEPQSRDFSEAEINGDNMYVCGLCSRVFKSVYSLTRHESTHSDERPYKCSLCNYAGKQKENLMRHMNTHTQEKQHKCQYCDYTSSKAHTLKQHLEFHTNKYPHQCSVCLYSTPSLGSLTFHCKHHHHDNTKRTNLKTLPLSNCDQDERSRALNSGVQEPSKIHQCYYCDYSTDKMYRMKLHLQAHTNKFPNRCHLCVYSTVNAGNLTAHYKNHHLNNTEGQSTSAQLEPLVLDSSEDNSEVYLEEQSSSTESPDKCYKCQYCEYSANSSYKCRDHMQYHTDIFPNKCHLCVYSTVRTENLLHHYKHHHCSNVEAMVISAPLNDSSPVQEKRYKCEHCEYTANRPSRLKEHSKFHTHEYTHKCHLCVYSTSNLGNLNFHYKNHHRRFPEGKNGLEHTEASKNISRTCEKLKNLTVGLERIPEYKDYFVCDVCQKTFMNKTVLTEHKKTHLDVSAYKCDICKCSFCELELLETHKKGHEKEALKQPTNSSEISNGLLDIIKPTAMKSYPIRSILSKVKIMSSKLQLNKRKSLESNSLHIGADVSGQSCKLVLHKLDISNNLKKGIQCKSGITNANVTESPVSLSESSSLQKEMRRSGITNGDVTESFVNLSKNNCLKIAMQRQSEVTNTAVTESSVSLSENNSLKKGVCQSGITNGDVTESFVNLSKNNCLKIAMQRQSEVTNTAVTKSSVSLSENNSLKKGVCQSGITNGDVTESLVSLSKSNNLRKKIRHQSGIINGDLTESFVNLSKNNCLEIEMQQQSGVMNTAVTECFVSVSERNSLKKDVSQSGVTNGAVIESCVSLPKSSKDKQTLKIQLQSVPKLTKVVQQHGKKWSLKNCVVKLISAKPEILGIKRLHRCLLCEFAGATFDSLKEHIDSQHKVEVSLKAHREFNHREEKSLTVHNEYGHRADKSLTEHSEPRQKAQSHTLHNKCDLKEKSNNASCQNEGLSLKLNTECKQREMYSCSMCKYTCRNIQDFMVHMLEHDGTEGQNSRFHKNSEISTELYSCDVCGFSCNQQTLFHQHLSVHKGRRPTPHPCRPQNKEDIASSSQEAFLYKCLLCSRKSPDQESMTKHMLTCSTKKWLW
ncbi:hypothetical protein BsWGS_08930 [Bradybaena similaris]